MNKKINYKHKLEHTNFNITLEEEKIIDIEIEKKDNYYELKYTIKEGWYIIEIEEKVYKRIIETIKGFKERKEMENDKKAN